jgi:hypothetical protein
MIENIFLQQHTRLDVILGSPMFTNKDLDFVNNASLTARAELELWGFDCYKLIVPFGKPLVNIYSYITH